MSRQPLHKKTILVTRPGEAGAELAKQLEESGAEAIIMPMIEIAAPDSVHEMYEAIKNIGTYDWLFFASVNAVNAFCKSWQNKRKHPKIAVIGEATLDVASKLGLMVDYCPSTYVAEKFVEQFPGYPRLSQKRILWPRTNIGRDLITKKLQAAGAIVDEVQVYKTVLPQNAEEMSVQLNQFIANKKLDAIILASNETARNLGRIISLNLSVNKYDPETSAYRSPSGVDRHEVEQIALVLKDILLVTIGPQTAEGALNYLGKESLQAKTYTTEGMLAALIDYYQKCKPQ